MKFKIFFNSGFLIGWDYIGILAGPALSYRIEQAFGYSGSLFVRLSSAFLYVTLARHSIYQYHELVLKRREKRTTLNSWTEITSMLNEFQQLDSSARFLIKDFASILFVLCFSSWISCLTASYFMILSFFDVRLLYLVLTWDTFQILESISRLVLLCCTTDHLVQTPVNIFLSYA